MKYNLQVRIDFMDFTYKHSQAGVIKLVNVTKIDDPVNKT